MTCAQRYGVISLLFLSFGCAAQGPATGRVPYPATRTVDVVDGNPKNPAHFPFLHAYSPQHNIKPGTCYPSILVTTALNDDRAPAWLAMKYTAALQAAQSCNWPIILRADTGGGHIGNALEDAADLVAFIAGQLGLSAPEATSEP